MMALVLAGLLTAVAEKPCVADQGNAEKVAAVERGELFVARADWWGFDPADSTAALKAAFASKARKVIIPKMSGPWYVTPIWIVCRSDLEIEFEEGAEICAKRGAFTGWRDMMIELEHCERIRIHGMGRLRMWKKDYQTLTEKYRKSQYRHALAIDASRDIIVEDIEIVESGGDGICLTTAREEKGFKRYCQNVALRNVKCLRNHRQGMSVIACENLVVDGCVFSDTAGTLPEAGIDFEPNIPGDVLVNCVVRNSLFERNRGAGIDFTLGWHAEGTPDCQITVENCILRDNRENYTLHMCGFEQNGTLRSNLGHIIVRNCIVREKGGVERPYSYDCVWGRPVRSASGKVLKPIPVTEWTGEAGTVVDDAPGESVRLSPLPVRMKPNYLFYAARPGTIRFSARQRPVGSSKPHQEKLVLSRFRGEKIAELPAPAVGGSDYAVEVPAKGFYRLYWPMEWVSTMTMTASDAPVALSGLAEYDKWGKYSIPFLQGEPAEAYFPVRESSGPFAAACNGIERGKVRATLTDPSGATVFERDGVGLDEVYVSSETPRAGLWTIAAARASKGDFNNYYFDLGGDVPPLLFLSKRKYWIGK